MWTDMGRNIGQSMWRSTGKRALQSLFLGYLRVLKRTLRVEWAEDEVGPGRQIFGFWHEDSFCMNLVLEQLAGRTRPVHVIVTADTRGDYIERMVESCGGHALRVADGRASFGRLKEILEEFQGRDASLAVALDGPLGPRHEPKKLAFYFAELLGAEFTGFTLSYSACIRLWRRWDKYAIPLPFSKVTVRAHGYGRVTKRDIGLLKQVELEYDRDIKAAGLDIRWSLPGEKVILKLDSQKAYRVFENLMVNITKYALPHTRVFIDVEETDREAVVRMKNVSAAELTFDTEEITDRFVRGDASRNTEGSGLGLAIARSFTELMHGTLQVSTEADLFRVEIRFPKP